jgi:hypothetical protein
MGTLLDPDPGFRALNVNELRVMMSRDGESVLRHGWALMELGRRTSGDAALLQEVAGMIRVPENRKMTAGRVP